MYGLFIEYPQYVKWKMHRLENAISKAGKNFIVTKMIPNRIIFQRMQWILTLIGIYLKTTINQGIKSNNLPLTGYALKSRDHMLSYGKI